VEPGAHPARQSGIQSELQPDDKINKPIEDQHPRIEKPTRHPHE
jgi:hypothetical protein